MYNLVLKNPLLFSSMKNISAIISMRFNGGDESYNIFKIVSDFSADRKYESKRSSQKVSTTLGQGVTKRPVTLLFGIKVGFFGQKSFVFLFRRYLYVEYFWKGTT